MRWCSSRFQKDFSMICFCNESYAQIIITCVSATVQKIINNQTVFFGNLNLIDGDGIEFTVLIMKSIKYINEHYNMI